MDVEIPVGAGCHIIILPDAKERTDGGVEVEHAHGILFDPRGCGVGLSPGLTSTHLATGDEAGEGDGMMVPPAVIDLRRAAKLRREHHQRAFEQPGLFKIGQKRTHRVVESRGQTFDLVEIVIVSVPAAEFDLDEFGSSLDQTPSQEQATAKVVVAIGFERLALLLVEIKGIEILAGHQFQGISIDIHMRLHFIRGVAAHERGIESIRQARATTQRGHGVAILQLRMLQTLAGIQDRHWGITRIEKAAAGMSGQATQTDVGRQCGVAFRDLPGHPGA